MQFKHLRMTGFKSFAEPSEMVIDGGMTGVVGPNGCGKSNIVEALRWLMGESSARALRGGEIDDLIFNGTESRPSRNFAEVVLTMDNTGRNAQEHLGAGGEIEISKKLDRGTGTTYRINGKVARAKDVQLLFADMATGSRSGGIVSQGQVGALIKAKPTERRNLLEEAASISGLHRRRHEAELRLGTAENNLERLGDILAELEEQRTLLAKQARQLARYRSVEDRIRKADARLMLTLFTASMARLEDVEGLLREVDREVAAAAEVAAARQRERDERNDELPPLRQAEAEASAEVQRLKIAHDELDKEEERAKQAAVALLARKEQITGDIGRERRFMEDAEAAIERMAAEALGLDAEDAEEAPRLEAAAKQLEDARKDSDAAQKTLADAAARSRSAEREAEGVNRRLQDLRERKARAEADLAGIDLGKLEADAGKAAEALEQARAEAARAGADRAEAETRIEAARASLDEASARRASSSESLAGARAEAETLGKLVGTGAGDGAQPVSGSVEVADGYEEALAAALGEGLSAPLGRHGDAYWSGTATASPPACPEGAAPLSEHVASPPELAAALAGVGLVGSAKAAEAQQGRLAPGQSLTTRKGGLWRWDGFVQPHGSENAAARRLHQEARLRELEEQLPSLAAAAESSEAGAAEAAGQVEALQSGLQGLREAEAAATESMNAALREEQRLKDATATAQSRHGETSEMLEALAASLREAEGEAEALKDPKTLRQQEEQFSKAAEGKSQALAEAMGAERNIRNSRDMRDRRRGEIAREAEDWKQRREGAERQIAVLGERQEQAEKEEQALKGVPGEVARKRAALGDTLERSEAAFRDAGDRLAEAETRLKQAGEALREAESALAAARETKIQREADCRLERQKQDDVAARIRERLKTGPEELPEIAGVGLDEQLDTSDEAVEGLQKRYDRLVGEKENVGQVNLLAEKEMEELEERVAGLEAERDDLSGAVAKLRTAIAELNREGRERLLKSFEDVNRYFGTLFETLFDGGTAKIQLSEEEDPLDAGLEILASPPGKKLQSLELLSGGEQALTAIALIFAVFLTNPSPICILDEVDAPLDDNNVGRFCNVLEQIAEKTGSRFILVTHHRLTMARMDRLYGVTMEEKGVSRMVSVDLQAVEALKKTA